MDSSSAKRNVNKHFSFNFKLCSLMANSLVVQLDQLTYRYSRYSINCQYICVLFLYLYILYFIYFNNTYSYQYVLTFLQYIIVICNKKYIFACFIMILKILNYTTNYVKINNNRKNKYMIIIICCCHLYAHFCIGVELNSYYHYSVTWYFSPHISV